MTRIKGVRPNAYDNGGGGGGTLNHAALTSNLAWTTSGHTFSGAYKLAGSAATTAAAEITYTAFTATLLDDVDAPTARATLGLGNVENTALSTWAGSTNITTLGTIGTGTWQGSTLAIAYGGTGSTSAGAARTALGLAIGTNVQAWDADLDGIAALGDGLPVRNTTWGLASFTGLSLTGSTLAVLYGVGSGSACQGNDSRLSDARTPTGSAGGDLAGTYPNPTVTQARGLRETSGPTTLAMGAVSTGQLLGRSGTTVAGVNASATPTASYVVVADASAKIDGWVSDGSTSTKGKLQLATDNESSASKACAANDSRLGAGGSAPYPDPTQFFYSSYTPNVATLYSFGSAATTSGTIAQEMTATYLGLRFSTAVVATPCGLGASSIGRLGHNLTFSARFRTDTDVANRRFRIGLYTGTPGSGATPGASGYYLLFRADSSVPDTNWQIVHGTSAGYTTTDTGIAFAVSKLMTATIVTSSGGVTYTLTDGTTSYTTSVTTNNPASSADIHMICNMITLTASSRAWVFHGSYIKAAIQ